MTLMRRIKASSCLLAAAAILATAAGAGLQTTDDGRWRILLRQQLRAEKSCDLNEILIFHEIPLGDEIAIDGRTSCIDGREFDFSRKRPHQKFDIQLCQPSVC
jgi:hypothetical protein